MISYSNRHHSSIMLSGHNKLIEPPEFLKMTKDLTPFYNSDDEKGYTTSNITMKKYKTVDGTVYILVQKDCFTFSCYRELTDAEIDAKLGK